MVRRVWILAMLAAWLVAERAARADGPPVSSAVIERVGFAGKFKVGRWTPLAVRVEADGACQLELQVEAADPDGNRTLWTSEFQADSAGSHRLAMLFQAGRLNVSLKPRLIATLPGSDESWTIPVLAGEAPEAGLTQTALTHDTLLVATLGNPGGLSIGEKANGEDPEDELSGNREKVHIAPIRDLADLTVSSAGGERTAFANASGLEAIDTFVISGRYDLTEIQSEALRTWVTLGGHLILSVGKDLEAYQNSPLADWVSGARGDEGPETFRLTGPTSFLRLDTLENFAGKDSEQILIDRQKPVAGVKIEPAGSAETILSVLSGPLIVRAPYGMGTVTFLGLSLSDEPIRSWPSLPKALRELLWDTQQAAPAGTSAAAKQLAYSGVSEFATQLQTALVTFPSVKRLSTWAVIGLLTVYLLVIGPVDYLLVHHLLRRPRLTWLTLPVLVAGTAVLAAWMAKSQNGNELMVSQVDVLDYDESTRTMRSRSWASLYSPETRRYRVSLKPAAFADSLTEKSGDPEVRMSWFGTPESSFGGMYREGGQQIQPPQYRFSTDANSIENLPIPIWGAKSMTGQWCRQGTAWVESDLESPRLGQLRGTIRHNFPVPITDWFVAYNTRVFLPRDNPATGQADPLAPGKEWPPSDPTWERVNQREIGGYLTRTVAKQFHQAEESGPAIFREQQPYDPLASANPDPLGDIFRILSFHQRVGGKQYSGLDNHFFRGMDLSNRLKRNQAVLFGRLDLPAAEFQIEDHTPQENLRATFVRIVLPVRKNHADADDRLRIDPSNRGSEP